MNFSDLAIKVKTNFVKGLNLTERRDNVTDLKLYTNIVL